MRKLILVFSLLIVGCATRTAIIPTSNDNFTVFKQGSGFWVQSSAIAAELMQEASVFCSQKSKALEVVTVRKEETGWRPGAFPEAELTFKCK
jgi:hypothetical protein